MPVRCFRSVTVFVLLAAAASVCAAQANDLTDDVRRLISGHKFGEAKIAVSILDLKTGTALAAVRAEDALIPASNMKLLSSGAALLTLGPDFVFRTELIIAGESLILRGGGDPSLADPDILSRMEPRLTVGAMLDALANAPGKAGMTSARELVVDDRVFDRVFVHPSWPVEQLSRGYCAQVSGLNFHANVLHVFPAPGPQGPGSPVTYTLQPEAHWLRVDVRAKTVSTGNGSAWLTRDDDANRFTLRGEVRHKSLSPIEVTIHDPPLFTGKLLADQLRKAGVSMPHGPDTVRLIGPDESRPEGTVIAVVTTPIAEILKRCNTDSANLYAECLLKRTGNAVTGEPGSWTNGAAVLRMNLTEKLGPAAAASTVVADGSGMSRQNAVTPLTLTRWLEVIAKEPKIAPAFRGSLAGVGEGTLRKRFQGVKLQNELRAKSGYISGVRTLSGYVTNEETGRSVAFSVMVNNIKSDDQHKSALELHEQVVQAADKWLSRRVAAERPAAGG